LDNFQDFINILKSIFRTTDLPGISAHERMRPAYNKLLSEKQKLKESAVLILLYPVNDIPHFVLMKRTVDNSPHSGQISLPGGKMESSDIDLFDTAIRETFEEIGIPEKEIGMIGQLTPVPIVLSGFRVNPFVGYIDYKPVWRINPREVDYLIEISLTELLNPSNVLDEKVEHNKKTYNIPFFSLKNEKVWGATAMILSEFKEMIFKMGRNWIIF
jgi:8-oxo-dGTP pyrophosphatase MutT (NUDIX family)